MPLESPIGQPPAPPAPDRTHPDAAELGPILAAIETGDLVRAERAAATAAPDLADNVAFNRLAADIALQRHGPLAALDGFARAARLATAAAGRALRSRRDAGDGADPETRLTIADALTEAAYAERWLGQCLHDCGRSTEAERAFARWATVRDRLAGYPSPDRKLVLLSDLAAHVGETGAQLDCHLKLAALGWIDGRRPVVSVGSKIGNRHFLNLWRDRVDVRSTADVAALTAAGRTSAWDPKLPLVRDGRCHVHPVVWSLAQQAWEAQGRPPLLTLPEADRDAGWDFLKRAVGIGDDDWFVALHLRDPAYKRETARRTVGDDHRHQSLWPTIDALSEITGRGGWVIRLGHPQAPPLPPMERVYDYARRGRQQPWLDSFFCAAARFFLGTASGPFSMATAFGTPIAASNWIPLSMAPPSRDHLFIFKRLYDRVAGRWLTAAEMLADPMRHAQRTWLYTGNKIDVVENDSDDIRALIRERLATALPPPLDPETILARHFGTADLVLNSRPSPAFLARHASILGLS